MHIQNLLREQDLLHMRLDKQRAMSDEGRGLENGRNYATCPTCDRATVLIEHEYTPQLRLVIDDSEPEREGTYFTCEWCNSPIDEVERAPRKPAASAGWESDDEWARRTA